MGQVLSAGTTLANRFEIERLAGAGGMGAVYRAHDQLTGGPVALKLVHAGNNGPEETNRFTREAQLLSSLRHPAIVSYVAHGITPQGLRFLAMEWLDGEDLAQRLSRGPLPINSALQLLRRIADALAFAHARGVLHRDLKPTNLFLPGGDVGQVKLLDFGIARRLAASRAMTRTGTLIGTPEYMAPEQARGERDLSAAVDLFSLGCVFYECLAGEPPFLGEHIAAVLVRILCEEPRPLAERRMGTPTAVSDLVQRLLVKDPARRMGSARLLVQAVDELGEQSELPLLATVPQPKKSDAATQADTEQTLLSLIVAHAPGQEKVDAAEDATSDLLVELEGHRALLSELAPLGGEASLLLGGALVVRVSPTGHARDQAAQAARLSLLVADRWPEARIAVVTGRGRLRQGLVTGEAIDRAWRLLTRPPSQDAAGGEPGSARIFVDEVSAGLLDGRFELQRLSSDGFALGAECVEPDAERRLLGKPTPCVGRERELAMLEGVLAECSDEAVARAVLVLAPPGMGKSRLRHELLRRIEARGEPLLKLMGRGDPMKTRASYGMLGAALRLLAGISPQQTPGEQQATLLSFTQQTLGPPDVQTCADFLGELCGIPFPDGNRAALFSARQDPQVMSDQVERAWLRWLRAAATKQPVMLVLEDLHWADALTVRLVHAALQALTEQPLMVLALARPEVQDLYPNLWGGLPVQLPLSPLPKKASERLVRQILGAAESPATVARISDQAAGNPLFLEELIRASSDSSGGSAPATVMAILQARIARLTPSARRLLRAASVYGQDFSEAGLRCLMLATQQSDLLRSDLDELVHEELIEPAREWRGGSNQDFHFHHALMREAAYLLLSEFEQVKWHAAAGSYLESIGGQTPAQLAEHFRLGHEEERAAQYYLRAAMQANEAADLDTSLACVEQGLACCATGQLRGQFLALRIAAWLYKERFMDTLRESPEALALLPRGSEAWCRVFTALFPAAAFLEGKSLPGLMQTFMSTNPDADARATYVHGAAMLSVMLGILGQRQGCQLARERAGQVRALLDASEHNALGTVHGAEANYFEQIAKRPQTNLRENLGARDQLLAACNRPALGAFGVYLGKSWIDLGMRERGIEVLRQNLQLALTLQDATPLAYSRTYLARALATSEKPSDWDEAERLARAVLEGQNTSMLGLSRGALAQVALARGDLDQAAAHAELARQILIYFPPYRADLAALHAQILRAQRRLTDALALCATSVAEYQALDIEPYGLLTLYLEQAECQRELGDLPAARLSAAAALQLLAYRTADITDGELRASYLSRVPENLRVLELARQWSLPPPNELAEAASQSA